MIRRFPGWNTVPNGKSLRISDPANARVFQRRANRRAAAGSKNGNIDIKRKCFMALCGLWKAVSGRSRHKHNARLLACRRSGEGQPRIGRHSARLCLLERAAVMASRGMLRRMSGWRKVQDIRRVSGNLRMHSRRFPSP